MLIKGLQKTSLIDYPGKISSVIFVAGCNFRCPYCQNPDLVVGYDELPTISEDEVLDYLLTRKKWLDGVCISGGEPTLYPDLPGFLKKVKDLGFLVKLDTNGTNPEMLEELIDSRLIDYVAMDVKAPLERYEEIVRRKVNLTDIEKSVGILQNSDVEYEFRTTVVPKLLNREDIAKISRWLEGSKRYFLQQFRPHRTLDRAFEEEVPFKSEDLAEMADVAKKYFQRVL